MILSSLFPLAIIACSPPSDPGGQTTTTTDSAAEDINESDWNPNPETTANLSSSEATISWTAPSEEHGSVDHYQILSREIISSVENAISIPILETEYTFENLKSDSDYEFSLTACINADCTEILIPSNDDTAISGEGISWNVRTTPERWVFSQNSSLSDFQIMILDGKNPSVLSFENTDGLDGRLLLSYTDTNTGEILLGEMELDFIGEFPSMIASSNQEDSIIKSTSLSHFTTSQFKPYQNTDGLGMQLFLGFEKTDQSTHIGFVSTADGLNGLHYSTAVERCAPADMQNCSFESSLDSNVEQIKSMSAFHVFWESFGLENMGASQDPLLIVEGLANDSDDGSIFYSYQNNDNWLLHTDESGYPKKWIQHARNVSVLNYNSLQSKVYYQSITDDNSLRLLYWYANASGEDNLYEFTDLEDPSTIRSVNLIDTEGNQLAPETFASIGDQVVWTSANNQRQYMLFTVLNDGSPLGLSLAYLSNP